MATAKSEATGSDPSCQDAHQEDSSSSAQVSVETDPLKNGKKHKKAKLLKSRVKRLEKKLELYDRKIKQIMESEVSLEEMDSDTSPYLHEDVLKRKFLKTWVELCELLSISPEVQIGDSNFEFKGTKYSAINKKVERLIRHDDFPDYWDICQLVQHTNDKHKLDISEKEQQIISRKLFQEVGESIKKKRVKMWNALFGCHLTDTVTTDSDPALLDSNLSDTLATSLTTGREKLNQVYEQFAFIQEEEGDKTASSSNGEEEEEENNGDTEDKVSSDIEDDGMEYSPVPPSSITSDNNVATSVHNGSSPPSLQDDTSPDDPSPDDPSPDDPSPNGQLDEEQCSPPIDEPHTSTPPLTEPTNNDMSEDKIATADAPSTNDDDNTLMETKIDLTPVYDDVIIISDSD